LMTAPAASTTRTITVLTTTSLDLTTSKLL
jgi:hypothetical protein